MKLVIAEKHSVAQAIAKALDPHSTGKDGYIQAGDAIVSWAQGHLVDLATPDQYEDEPWHEAKWRWEDLPISPMTFKWQVSQDKGAGTRYRQLVTLINRNDVDTLVNACDPDREGEAIFRRIIGHAHVTKPALRLWVASLEEDAIQDAWARMKPESEYDGLAAAADCRAKADWLVGMNATRVHTLLYRRRLTMGRVQTPTLSMIVERDRAISGHKPEKYWTVRALMDGWTLVSGHYDNPDQAETVAGKAKTGAFTVTKAERKTVNDRPPHLYDLTGLQKDMSRLHGMTAAATLSALQHLYEMKLATYPRTDSQYITHDDLDTLRRLTEGDRLVDGFVDPTVLSAKPRPELTVNDQKVAGHTAILPTMSLDRSKLDELSQDERLVVTRIVRRMWEAIGDDHKHLKTTVKATLDGTSEEFTAGTDVTIEPGWKGIEPKNRKTDKPEDQKTDKPEDQKTDEEEPAGTIPDTLAQGDRLHAIDARVKEGETKPPAPFTEATLLAAMEHASRYVDDKDLKAALDDDVSHSGGIGTPATRADIIEKLVSSKYVERRGKQLRSTDEGRLLVHVAAPELTNVATTAEWERMLSDMEHGDTDADIFMGMIRGMIADLPAQAKTRFDPQCKNDGTAAGRESFGPCPRCGKPVVKTGHLWQCSTNRHRKTEDGKWELASGCGYTIHDTISGKKLTDQLIRKILAGGSPKVTGFVSRRTGRGFEAKLAADKERGIRMIFDQGGKR
ncbi:type IA DNA topoisomerase [Bifidobacterium biavatii]|uniref:DNA topoisomerase n=1 Tax=Bifidobacterium biavatii DSM 23969 TaxID=1437608 RepID=A0A086ZHV8_9BIFI|nr:type IA DNA topoisomerase [Bifidobacterium biavatii]KFI46108.1 DNA topoisomerase III [Bifidobacterium biavatii DSM 23969]